MSIAILSPHFDDAVLGCWHVLASDDEVDVINVFAGIPPEGTSGWWDRLSGNGDSAASVRFRREEDQKALTLVGRRSLNLDFLDMQYREADQPLGALVEAVAGRLEPGQRVLAPAALGDQHPDHRLVRDAAIELADRGFEVALYADLPHATANGSPAWLTGGRGQDPWRDQLPSEAAEPSVDRLDPDALERKHEALRAYASQLAPLEHMFGPRIWGDLLAYEVTWPLGARAPAA